MLFDRLSPRAKALLARTLLGLMLVEIPVVSYQLTQSTFDYRLLAVGLLGAAAAYLDKALAPQLADTLLPGTTAAAPPPPAPLAPIIT